MTKIIIAPDKFKGSLSGLAFCKAVEKGILKHTTDVDILHLPLADGGDGTIEVLNYYLDGVVVSLQVNDPLFRKIKASYLYSKNKKTAYIEMSEASGIRLLDKSEVNPMLTSTYGTGEIIKHAIDNSAEHIILGIGGSATNDAGLGMARALGYQFFDCNKKELKGIGQDLIQLARIDESGVHPDLHKVMFELACDVDNPLYGPKGASFVYARQKGATPQMIAELDAGLKHFNDLILEQHGQNLQAIKGAGAAGGLGAGGIVFLNANLNSGIELIKKEANLNKHMANADWIITGEGKLDAQTLSGKVIKGVMDSRTHQKLAIFCGTNELAYADVQNLKVDYIKETFELAKGIDDSIKNADKYLQLAAEDFAKKHLI